MTAPGLLDFFVLEASEYLEQLDQVLGGGVHTPDLDALQRATRGLRGSATMAKLPAFADLAGALEKVGRAVREGSLPWDRSLGAAMVGTVDELKALLHSARAWSDVETGRARGRASELMSLLPREAQAHETPAPGTSVAYVSNETANVAAGLEFLLTAPGGGGDAGLQVLQRIRALRGIAAIRDVPALGDALEAAEQAATPLEHGRPLGATQREVLHLAARLLRDLALAVRAGRTIGMEALHDLEQALDAWLDEEEGAGMPIVPIEALFHGDAGPHVVTATPNPPTTAPQRFQLEMVSNGEHLRLLVEEAVAADPAARSRYRRHIRRSLRAIRRTAESFGETAVAEALGALVHDVAAVDDATLDRLAAVARRLAAPGSGEALAADLRQGASRAGHASAAPAPAPVPTRPAPAVDLPPSTSERQSPTAAPAAPAARRPTPSGTELAALLGRSVSAVGAISAQPLAEPAALEDIPIVPVSALLYRGKAALHRALELRNEIKETGGPPDPAAIDELFDLIELALAD